MIKYGSVCSGIEAASVAWEPLGFSPEWFAEIEKFPSQVLAHHWPKIKNLGDMTAIAEQIYYGNVSAPDVLVGGTPCQAFSVAGLRKGLDDLRGQLTLSYVVLLNAIDEKRRSTGLGECVAVWENVPGVLSSKDNAFGCFLAGLAGEDEPLQPSGKKWPNAGCVFGPQRAVAWRILDAQYFGVPQRRRRVFVVASARAGFDPTKVLFEFEGVRRDIAPCRNSREEITLDIAPSLRAQGNASHRLDSDAYVACHDVAPTLNAHFGEKQGLENQHVNGGCGLFVVHGTQDPCTSKTTAFALGRNNGAENAISYGIPGNWIGRSPENGGNAVEPMHDVSPCLTGADRHCVASVALRGREGGSTAELGGDLSGCLRASSGGGDKPHILAQMQVRRLTPIECERLQGFPDDHTKINDKTPDGPRYKALGNSMAVPCMAWIGKRLMDYLK